ncbi:MAG: ABC transporter ATP-binding protein [Clostridia bacterium]|nr:ABC transporter ATP-binding protein [Clostridia bacterium]
MNVLEIHSLEKRFGDKRVLCGLDMIVPEGSVFGFVGRNGAGKTTTMKSVLGLLRPDGGEIFVAGEAVKFGQTPTNRHIGYLPDVPEFYAFMTPREYLQLCGECMNMEEKEIRSRSEELLELVGLGSENHRIKGFSRGMKQRLGVAQALLGSPKLLICDEPTSALDPIGRREILDVLISVRERTTVLFSTHVLSDVESICTDVALLEGGRIAMQGAVSELKRAGRREEFRAEMLVADSAEELLEAFPDAVREGRVTVAFSGGEERIFEVLSFIGANKLPLRKIERAETSLESLFAEVIK